MKIVNRFLAFGLLLLVFTALVVPGIAEAIHIDYNSLTLSELEQIVQDANDAIERNHKVDHNTSSALESKTKVSVVQLIPNLQKEPSWRWFDWTYKREWSKITVITEVKIDDDWLPLEAEYEEANGEYALIRLVVDDNVYLDKSNKASDNDASTKDTDDSQADKAVEQEVIIAQKGDTSDAVRDIQTMLIKLGLLNGKADGQFGEKTRKGIELFQKKMGLERTGIVTETVYSLLVDECSKLPEKVEPEKIERVTAVQLYEAFNENEIAADSKYKDKVIEVKGEINSVDKTWGSINVNFDVYWLPMVSCRMKKDQTEAVEKLKKGQTVIIRGKCIGSSLTFVNLEDCTIVG